MKILPATIMSDLLSLVLTFGHTDKVELEIRTTCSANITQLLTVFSFLCIRTGRRSDSFQA